MSNLVTSASPWTNDDNPNQKRTPTMRKTIKMRPSIPSIGEPDEYVTQTENYQNLQSSSFDDVQAASQDRNSRVNELLNKITSADTALDNNKLGDFKPLMPPSINTKKDTAEGKKYVPPNLLSTPSLIDNKINYGANDTPSAIYSNYIKSYEPPAKMTPNQPYYAKMGLGNQPIDNKIMEKINYMIHMMEDQHNEKTNNITEEFILYTFLGVFMIFLVDSFARSGKYTR